MNLVAKEYVASQLDDDGVLVLSEFAGAVESLGDAALVVNPNDIEEFATTIEAALDARADAGSGGCGRSAGACTARIRTRG